MTEIEYINATNLAKIRIANIIIRDIFPNKNCTKEEQVQIIDILYKWSDRLEKKVVCDD